MFHFRKLKKYFGVSPISKNTDIKWNINNKLQDLILQPKTQSWKWMSGKGLLTFLALFQSVVLLSESLLSLQLLLSFSFRRSFACFFFLRVFMENFSLRFFSRTRDVSIFCVVSYANGECFCQQTLCCKHLINQRDISDAFLSTNR